MLLLITLVGSYGSPPKTNTCQISSKCKATTRDKFHNHVSFNNMRVWISTHKFGCKHGKVDNACTWHKFNSKWFKTILWLWILWKDCKHFENILIHKAKQFMLTKKSSKKVYIILKMVQVVCKRWWWTSNCQILFKTT